MKQLGYLYFLLTVTFSVAQNDTTFYNRDWFETETDLASYYRVKDKVSDSLWHFKDYYVKNDQIQNEGYYITDEDETRDSLYTWYHENGEISLQGNYNRGNRIGSWSTYHENGKLKFTGKYKEDLRSGKWKWWFESGEVRSVAKYKKGNLEGQRLWWYEDGKLRLEENFDNGQLDGNVSSFYENGRPEIKQTYTSGMPADTSYAYYSNGQLKFKKLYKSGIEIDSISVWFDSTGALSEREKVEDEKANHQLLWEVSGNGLETPSYVFGTMHVRDPRAFEFSDTMITIFESCEATSMEIHPDSMFAYLYHSEESERIASLMRMRVPERGYRSSGRRWYARRDHWLKDLNGLFNRPYGPPNAKPYFVDVYLFYLSKLRGKNTFGLEDVQEHINAGDDLPTYRKKYDILSEFDPDEEMIDVYRLGDIEKIKALMDFLTNKEFNYRLLTLRNYKMADQIDSLSNSYKTFHTCGCAHLYGKEGVLQLLRDKGYSVNAIAPEFNGSEFTVDRRNYDQKWHLIEGENFQARFPGKPVTSYRDGYPKHIFMDFVTKNGYSLSIVDLTNDSLEVNKKHIRQIIDRFTSADGENVNLEKSKIQGRKAYSFTERSEYGTELEQYEIILDPPSQRVFILYTGAVTEIEDNAEVREDFFHSLSFSEDVIEPVEWTSLKDTLSAFRVDFPANYNHKYRPREERSSAFYWSYEGQENEYSIRVWDQDGGWWNKDTTNFKWSRSYYERTFGELIKEDSGSFKGYPYRTWTISPKEDAFIKIHQIRRGIRTYTLFARYSPKTSSEVETFFNSFEFLDFIQHDWVTYSPEGDSVSIELPYEPEKKWWNGSNTYVYRNAYDYGSILGGGLSEDEFYEGYDGHSWYGNNYNESLLTESDYSSKYEVKESYEVLDSLSGIYYQFDKKTFTEYASYPDLDSMLQEWTPDDDLDTVSFSWINDGTAAKMIFDFHYQGRTIYRRMKHYYYGGHLYTLRCYYPEEVQNNSSIDYFLNSFQLNNLPDTLNPFGDKKEQALADLTSSDSITQLRATGALDYLDFTEDDYAILIKAIEAEVALDTNDIFDNSYDIFYLLNNLQNDSCSFTTDLTNYYVDFFEANCDTTNEQLFVLKSLASIGTDSAYSAFAKLIPDSLGVKTYNHYRSYRYRRHGSLSSAFDEFEDSLELFVEHYDKLAPLLTKPSTERIILDLLTDLYADDDVDKSTINEDDHRFITSYAHEQMARLLELTKDSSDYWRMVNKTQDVLPILREITLPDSTLSLVDSLRSHKNEEIQLGANIMILLQSGSDDQSKMEEILEDHPDELELISDLKDQDLLNLVPDKYLTQEHIALLGLTQSLKSDNYLHRKPYIEKVKLLETYLYDQDSVTTRHYIFQYYRGSSRKRYIAITGPQPEDENEINWDDYYLYAEEKYPHKSKAKKVVKSLKEKLKNGELGEDFEEAATEYFEF